MTQTAQDHYAEAERLNALDKPDAARIELQKAAALGHVDAAYRLSISEISGIGGAVDQGKGHRRLAAIKDTYPPARMLHTLGLACGWSAPENWQSAIDAQIAAARAGDPGALLDIGLICLMASEDLSGEAQACLTGALRGGALYAAPALMRWHILRGERFVPPAEMLRALAEASYLPVADLEKTSLQQTKPPTPPTGAPDWDRITSSLKNSPENWLKDTPETLDETIGAYTWRGAVHPCVCDYLLGSAGPILKPAEVFDPETGRLIAHPTRRAMQAGQQFHQQTLVVHAAERLLTRAAGLPWRNGERVTVLLYRQGDAYAPHVDYFSDAGDVANRTSKLSGQRKATALLALRPCEEGGETNFPHLKTAWTGAPGDVLVFQNLTETGAPNPMTLHEGKPVKTGWKALASLWIRERTYEQEPES